MEEKILELIKKYKKSNIGKICEIYQMDIKV